MAAIVGRWQLGPHLTNFQVHDEENRMMGWIRRSENSKAPWRCQIAAVALAIVSTVASGVPLLAADLSPNEVEELRYDHEFFPGTKYDPEIPTPEEILGFRTGDRAAFPHEIESYLETLAAASPRVELREYARSHEGRALHYLVISSVENIARLEGIQKGMQRLADPRGLAASEAKKLTDELPAPGWLAYSIHGDETSGSDASMAVAHHLAAGMSAEVEAILENVVVLIDPMQNPDGRHRYLQQIAEFRGKSPNFDDMSLLRGYWPWGRGNHYLFDLNRDWILGVQPETRGRIRAASSWHPLLFVDIHEMGAQNTYLFSPTRSPRNPHLSSAHERWENLFAREQSEAFDRWNWLYYTGEWNEGWYAGYTDSWGGFRGALGILYEQAGYAEDGVRIASGDVMTYRGGVHRQAVSSIANLASLAKNRREMLAGFAAEKREAVAPDGPYSKRTFAILPSMNRSRLSSFLDQMDLQGFEVYVTDTDLAVSGGVDQLGVRFGKRSLPTGTILLPNRQPEARLLAAMLEFDAPMPADYLERERRSVLRTGQTSIYDLTAWNLTMFYGLEALTVDGDLSASSRRVERPRDALPAAAAFVPPDPEGAAVARVVDGVDDASVALAARLVERGVEVRVAEKPFELGGHSFSRGSVVVLPFDNRRFDIDFNRMMDEAAAELELVAAAVPTGLGDGDLPDLGGGHFRRLVPLRIAVLARQGVDGTDFGSIWHAIDQRLAIRHSHLDREYLALSDLGRYNVVVLPNAWRGELSEAERKILEDWVDDGGTLIAIARSAAQVAASDSELSDVRGLADVLDKLEVYELALERERQWRASEVPDTERIWSHTLDSTPAYPWDTTVELERPGAEELRRRDTWAAMFMPQGAFLAARTDQEHWLSFGSGEILPVLFGRSSQVLMAADGVEAPVRAGALLPAEAEAVRVGWSTVPAGHELRVRMSGLLWPEAASRVANTALVTRESKGRGQVILFASPPTFRGTSRGTERLFMNALVYGPGFGATASIEP
jgi:hypothetical protein